MGAGGLYGIGISGTMAYQSALNVTGNNLANMSDPDYTRRVPEFSERAYGTGVDHNNTNRMYSEYLTNDMRNAISNYNQYAAYYDMASSLADYLGNDSSSVATAFNDFFSALQEVNSNPSSSTSRQQFLNQAESLVSRFQNLDSQVNDQITSVNQQINSSVKQVNLLSNQVADLNVKLMGANQDQTLLDQRDALIKDIAQYVPVTTRPNQDGSIDVYLSNGVPLVTGSDAANIVTMQDPEDPKGLTLAVEGQFHTTIIGNDINGGAIGGLFNYYDEVLKPAQLELNRLSLVVADKMNQQHQEGVTLEDKLGGNLFNDINEAAAVNNRVTPNQNNTGSASFSVTIDNVTDLTASNYELKFSSATDYTLVRTSDGEQVASGTIGGLPAQVSVDGFTMQVDSGTLAAGDKYTITPMKDAVHQMEVTIKKPEQLALAAAIRTTDNINNQGDASVSFDTVTDVNNASFATDGQLSPPLRIEFLSDTSYQIVNSNTSAVIEGPLAYTPGSTQAVFPTPGTYDPGYRININGAAKAGDTFNIDFNTNSAGDNRNGLLLQSIQTIKSVDGGNSTLSESYGVLSGNVAGQTNSAKLAHDATDMVMQQAQARRNNFSGVNDQEEISNMMFYLKAFEANAKLVLAADDMFSTLMDLM